MKVAVINFSGNVGKTTVSRHLLAPRLNNAQVMPVESINSDESEDDAIKGKQFGQLQEALLMMDDAVVDIGASNVEDFIDLMKQYKGSYHDYDYFVIPTVPKNKQIRDTVGTIDALSDIGVPAKKIRVVFNMIEHDDNPEQLFSSLYDYHDSEKKFTLRKSAIIHVNEIYGKLKGTERGISDILADETDYKEELKKTTDQAEKQLLAQLIALKRLADGVTDELDAVFKTLFK